MDPCITNCMSLNGWIQARRAVPEQDNPTDDPQVHKQNVLARRAAVRDQFKEFDLPLLVDEIPLPDVRLGLKFFYGTLFGAEVADDGAVTTHPWERFNSAAEIEDIEVPDIESEPEFQEALSRYQDVASRYNGVYDDRIVGFMLCQGEKAVFTTVNMAFHLIGQRIYEDMYVNPEFAHAVYKKCGEIQHHYIAVKERVEGRATTHVYLGECCNTMLSPKCYEEFCLPHAVEAMKRYGTMEMHNCGVVTQHLGIIPQIGSNFRWIELGWGTDLEHAREHLGDHCLLPRFGVTIMQEWEPAQVYTHMRKVLDALAHDGPVGIHSNCINAERTSEEALRAVFRAAEDSRKAG